MRDRIMGQEIEWLGNFRASPIHFWREAGKQFEDIRNLLNKEFTRNCLDSGFFLSNGGCLSKESTGEHIETSTPECNSAREVLKYDKWQEHFICWISEKLEDDFGEFVFHKKSSDDNLLHSRGCHENHLSEKKIGDLLHNANSNLASSPLTMEPPTMDQKINYLVLFLITRQIFTGSGGIMIYSSDKRLYAYEISPRTYFINAIFGTSAVGGLKNIRPMILVRNEPLADSKEYWRHQFVLGDANMADLSIFLKFGTTSAVLEMIEEGFYDQTLNLLNPFRAISLLKKVSRDLTLQNVPIQLVNGKTYSSIEIQERFCQNFKIYLEYSKQGGEKAEIAQRWQEILGRLKIDDEKVYSQLDYKIKFRLIKNYMESRGLSLIDNRVRSVDLNYHSPDPEKSLYYLLKNRSNSKFESLFSESEILESGNLPPENRAKLRAYLMQLLKELGVNYKMTWDLMSFETATLISNISMVLYMPEPHISSIKGLDLEKSRDAINYLNSLKPGAIIIS